MGFLKKLFGSNKSDNQNAKIYILTCCTSEIAMSTMKEAVEKELISKMQEDSPNFRTLYKNIDKPSVQVFRKSAIVANTKSAVVSTATAWLRSELGSDAPSDINAIYGKSFFEREGYTEAVLGTSFGFSVMIYFHGFSR